MDEEYKIRELEELLASDQLLIKMLIGVQHRLWNIHKREIEILGLDPDEAFDIIEESVNEGFTLLCNRPEQWNPNRGTLANITFLKSRRISRREFNVLHRSRKTTAACVAELKILAAPTNGESDGRCSWGHLELQQSLRTALAKLTPQQSEVIYLYFWGGYRVREISSIKGKSINAVRSLIRRALVSLKRALINEELKNTPSEESQWWQ